jgi:hypothetical protein
MLRGSSGGIADVLIGRLFDGLHAMQVKGKGVSYFVDAAYVF